MVGKTNVGGASTYATIGVTYPAGSTLTCTNGTTTLKAKTTTGNWAFAVPSKGTWTVKAVSGSNTATKSVNITSEGQFESVELSYDLSIFKEGTGDISSLTGGWDAHCNSYGGKEGSITFSKSHIDFYSIGNQNHILTKNMVDFNGYSSLELEFKWDGYDSNSDSYLNFAVHNASAVNGDTYTQQNMLASLIKYNAITGNRQTVSLDISSVSSGKIGLAMRQAGHLYVYNISAKK